MPTVKYDPVAASKVPDTMTTREVMEYLRKAETTLIRWRKDGYGPVWKKNKYGWVRYLRASVVSWKDSPAAKKGFDHNPFAVEEMEDAQRLHQKALDGQRVDPAGYPKHLPPFKDTFEFNYDRNGAYKPGRRVLPGHRVGSSTGWATEFFDPTTGQLLNSLEELRAIVEDGNSFSQIEQARELARPKLAPYDPNGPISFANRPLAWNEK